MLKMIDYMIIMFIKQVAVKLAGFQYDIWVYDRKKNKIQSYT